jgi:hypothetical protein
MPTWPAEHCSHHVTTQLLAYVETHCPGRARLPDGSEAAKSSDQTIPMHLRGDSGFRMLGHRLPVNRNRRHKADRARDVKPCGTPIDAPELYEDNAKHCMCYLQQAASNPQN